MKHQYLKWLSAIGASLVLAACSEQQSNNANPPSTSQAQSASAPVANANHNPDYPTYLVGSEVNYEPFEFKDEHGSPIGFEVELLQEIAKKEKFNVTIVNTQRKMVEQTLNSDQFAIWASTLSVTPERAEKMDFSQPFLDYTREIYILDKPENANLKTVADFKGKKLAVNGDSKSFVDTASELTGSTDNVLKTKTFYLSLTEMYKGSADGTLGDSRLLQYYQNKQKDIKTRSVSLGEKKKDIAFAVKKGNTEMLTKLNNGLAAVKADGTYDKLLEKWFGQGAK